MSPPHHPLVSEVPDMRTNGQTVKLSTLKPYEYSIPPARYFQSPTPWYPFISCPACGEHRQVRRTFIEAHRAADGVKRCKGSGTKVIFDVTGEDWALALREDAAAVEYRRSNRVKLKPDPAPATPVHRIALAH
jgi:hypothetical protein